MGGRRFVTSYKEKKVISIGTVKELTGLTERKIRYYEERGLIFPERTKKGTRKYSFADIEELMNIANKREEGVQTSEIRQDMQKAKQKGGVRDQMLRGQLNAHFNLRK
ncbi:MerR family transcriptional regulator [Salinibacillus kushneri]|nr:MerR family transcriptional regulator [Salinibacillus kushneri]